MTLEEVLTFDEKQIFDRKSIFIKPTDLSDTLCAFANADGGTVAIGISDKTRRIEGVDSHLVQLNEILRVPIDFCNPTVPVSTEMVDCINSEGKPDHVLLKRENIRYTHFSRNPKIAAFLKDYGYVKEYGEGVDRMCKELEAIGLPDPVFNNSTFILKTTVMSATHPNFLPIETAKLADSDENLPIETAKIADSDETRKADATNEAKKISFESYSQAYRDKGYNASTILNLNTIYDQIETNQVFGSAYLKKILECSERTGRSLLSKLKEMNVVAGVSGKGKGMFRFKNVEEK